MSAIAEMKDCKELGEAHLSVRKKVNALTFFLFIHRPFFPFSRFCLHLLGSNSPTHEFLIHLRCRNCSLHNPVAEIKRVVSSKSYPTEPSTPIGMPTGPLGLAHLSSVGFLGTSQAQNIQTPFATANIPKVLPEYLSTCWLSSAGARGPT